ncbi:MAG: hypothetical protein LBB84_07835 [Tannerellaceae bacterium]|jgi:hypothetical protein|nr:hypothetical protein [Tannerellaceae bacterium]
MLYYKFCNFEGFQDLFGIQHHGNGEKSRKNKILLSYLKNSSLLHDAVVSGNYCLLHISNMAELKQILTNEIIRSGWEDTGLPNKVKIREQTCHSALCRTDDYNGLCEDGDSRSFRYVNTENGRVFKMKIGKFYRKIILETDFGRNLPEQTLTYLCEEMAQDWQAYARSNQLHNKLYVNDDFEKIYSADACEGDFHSCMADEGYHSFYKNAVDASAACLEKDNGMIIARCIIYNRVKDQNGKVWRLAERQYSTESNDILKRLLVDALIKGDYIDGYKKVGAGCSDSRAFVDNEGNPLNSLRFSIDCDLDFGDILSYQDSFKSYDEYARIADNFKNGYIGLDVTCGELENEDTEYDDYHDCDCREVTRVYYHGHEYYCDSDNLDDFIYVRKEDEYHHEDDVCRCERCYENFLSEGGGCYSEITEEDYCCPECMETSEQEYKKENWTYSEYDETYFEDEDDVTEYMCWLPMEKRYERRTISVDTLGGLLNEGVLHSFAGVSYDRIDKDLHLPYGMSPNRMSEQAAA